MPGKITGSVILKNTVTGSPAEVGARLLDRLVEALQAGPDDDHAKGMFQAMWAMTTVQ